MALPAPEWDAFEFEDASDEFQDKNPAMSVEEAFDRFSAVAPRGWRVELIEGDIHVTPPANGEHEEMVSGVAEQVILRREDRVLRPYTGIGLNVPGASKTGKVVPDLVVAPKGSFDDELEFHDPAPVLLVAEVTSSATAGNDRVKKLRGYARAGIPVYLLIDREAGKALLCTEPAGDGFVNKVPYSMPGKVPLPEPLGFDLDTSEF
ncbi:Uma2 family endonuclease [Streptomyces sp. NPDC051561]|uniref:Uma2 family endonuclease n=1 Tax=Streptomyces sp. NPDC051561 TaxID=3365658 RepID=UPI0037A2E012